MCFVSGLFQSCGDLYIVVDCHSFSLERVTSPPRSHSIDIFNTYEYISVETLSQSGMLC